MTDIAVVGTAMTRFTKQPERGDEGLVQEAVTGALAHAGLAAGDVQAVFCGTVLAGPGAAQRLLKGAGLAGLPMINLENACASSTVALVEATAWIRAGMADVALVLGVETLSWIEGPLRVTGQPWLVETGLNLPAWYALKASHHIEEYGLTREQLASVVVKSRECAAENPVAHFRKRTSVDEVLSSPMIAEPLTLFQCCPKVDGASAAIVCSGDAVKRLGLRPTWLRGIGLVSGTHVFTDNAVNGDPTQRAAAKAYGESAVGPEDVDVIECHDAFSIGEIIYAESLGVCAPGDGGGRVAAGEWGISGPGPAINPSGGLLSKGHPLGATGMGQLHEIVSQLRGEAGARQREGARIGVVQTMGAAEFELDANACVVAVLEAA